jgi:hypothetical protein
MDTLHRIEFGSRHRPVCDHEGSEANQSLHICQCVSAGHARNGVWFRRLDGKTTTASHARRCSKLSTPQRRAALLTVGVAQKPKLGRTEWLSTADRIDASGGDPAPYPSLVAEVVRGSCGGQFVPDIRQSNQRRINPLGLLL